MATLLHCGYVLLAPVPFLETRPVVDDTFYYWMIARRFWAAHAFTFDGLNATNGFQPLWQLMLLPFGLLPRDVQLRLSLLLAAALYQGAAWLLALWPLRDRVWRAAGRVAALALWANARFVFEYASSGMEFGLYLLAAVWATLEALRFFDATLPKDDWPPGSLARLALATSLLPLARVDGLALSCILWLAVGFRAGRERRVRALFAHLSSLLPLGGWMCWNHRTFGTLLPVSGIVKRLDRVEEMRASGLDELSGAWFSEGFRATGEILAGNVLRFFSGWLPPGPWERAPLVAAGGATAAGVFAIGIVLWRRTRREEAAAADEIGPNPFAHRPPWAENAEPPPPPWPPEPWRKWLPASLLLAFAAVQAAAYAFWIPAGVQYAQWYYGPAYAGMALAAGAALARWDGALARVALGLLPLQLAAMVLLPQPTQVACAGARDALRFLELEAGGRPVIAGSWNAGIVSFRAPDNVRVVNLDGLVNSAEYARTFAAGRDVRPYIAQAEIGYLIDYATGPGEDAWRRILALRLGGNPGAAGPAFEPVHIGALPADPRAEPRRYHVLRVLSDDGARAE